MPISHAHAFGRGMVSAKAARKHLPGMTRMSGSASMGLKGKVVGFDSSKATDEHLPDKGKIPKNEINARAQQKTARVAGQTLGIPGVGGKGGYKSARGGQPTRDAINQNNAKKFPASSQVRRGNARYKNRGNSGGSDNNGPAGIKGNYYGSTETNKYG